MNDFRLGDTIDIKFTTRRFSTGAPFTLAGSPAVAAYEDNSVTEITAGITLTVDFDSRTGLNNVRIVATGANGYSAGKSYALVITAGTVDSVSVVGEVIGEFSLERTSAVMPTIAGRTLDVSAGGEAGIDWANVGSATTTQSLTNTTVKTATDIEARLPSALTGDGNMKADVLAISGDILAADLLEALMDGAILAQVNGTTATQTAFAADGFTEDTDGHFKRRLITFITGSLKGQQTYILDYDAAGNPLGNQLFTVEEMTEAPADNDFFVIH